MADKPRLTDEDRANLVAFLDGELDEQTALELEAKLSADPAARADAEALDKAWELLDYLPRAEASPSFTHRTMERVSAVRTHIPVGGGQPRRSRWWLGVGWAAAVLLAVALGYAGASLLGPKPPPEVNRAEQQRQQMIQDLRVLENLHLYQEVDDVEFLRALDHPDLFGDDSTIR